jgi:hypothetical protein
MNEQQATREERNDELVAMWRKGRKGQTTVLGLCHRALPEGQTLRAGMSIFDTILDHEFGAGQAAQAAKI